MSTWKRQNPPILNRSRTNDHLGRRAKVAAITPRVREGKDEQKKKKRKRKDQSLFWRNLVRDTESLRRAEVLWLLFAKAKLQQE